MRWGQIREPYETYFRVTGFLWFPKHRLSGWRWLEKATWWKWRSGGFSWQAYSDDYADWID